MTAAISTSASLPNSCVAEAEKKLRRTPGHAPTVTFNDDIDIRTIPKVVDDEEELSVLFYSGEEIARFQQDAMMEIIRLTSSKSSDDGDSHSKSTASEQQLEDLRLAKLAQKRTAAHRQRRRISREDDGGGDDHHSDDDHAGHIIQSSALLEMLKNSDLYKLEGFASPVASRQKKSVSTQSDKASATTSPPRSTSPLPQPSSRRRETRDTTCSRRPAPTRCVQPRRSTEAIVNNTNNNASLLEEIKAINLDDTQRSLTPTRPTMGKKRLSRKDVANSPRLSAVNTGPPRRSTASIVAPVTEGINPFLLDEISAFRLDNNKDDEDESRSTTPPRPTIGTKRLSRKDLAAANTPRSSINSDPPRRSVVAIAAPVTEGISPPRPQDDDHGSTTTPP